MKKVSVTILFEQEKLRALQFYMSKKETAVEAELDEYMVKLYEKFVPAQTREYIESVPDFEEKPRPRSARPTRQSVATEQVEEQDGSYGEN